MGDGRSSKISKGALGSAHPWMGRRSVQHEPGQPPAPATSGARPAADSLQAKARISAAAPLICRSSSPHTLTPHPGSFCWGNSCLVSSLKWHHERPPIKLMHYLIMMSLSGPHKKEHDYTEEGLFTGNWPFHQDWRKSNVQTACVFIQLYWDGSFSVFSVR